MLVKIGGTYWDSNLDRVRVTGVALVEKEYYHGKPTGQTVTWYDTVNVETGRGTTRVVSLDRWRNLS